MPGRYSLRNRAGSAGSTGQGDHNSDSDAPGPAPPLPTGIALAASASASKSKSPSTKKRAPAPAPASAAPNAKKAKSKNDKSTTSTSTAAAAAPARSPRPNGKIDMTSRGNYEDKRDFLLHARLLFVDSPFVWRQVVIPHDLPMDKLHLLLNGAFGWAMSHAHSFKIRSIKSASEATPDSDDPDPGAPESQAPKIVTKRNPEGFTGYDVMFTQMSSVHDIFDSESSAEFIVDIHKDEPDYSYSFEKTATFGQLNSLYDLSAETGRYALVYEYDHGDGWEHFITVEKRLPHESAVGKIGLVTDGKGHSVAEDAGGPPGWDECKLAYQVKGTKNDDEEYKEKRQWYTSWCGNGDKKGLKGKARLEYFDVKEANEMVKFYQTI